VRRVVVLVVATVLLAGCGGSSGNKAGTSTSNGEASKSAAQVLADTEAAVTSASSLHVAGNGFSGKQPIEVDLSVGTKAAKGSISLGGLGLDLIRVNDTIYIRGSDAFYKHFAGVAAAQLLHDKWLKVPASNDQLAPLSGFTNTGAFFKQVASTHGKLANQGLTTYRGQQVVAIHDATKNATLYVAATGKPYPVAVVTTRGGNRGTLTFSDWDQSFSVSPPKGAIDASQLGG
jgi:hypothetical protein